MRSRWSSSARTRSNRACAACHTATSPPLSGCKRKAARLNARFTSATASTSTGSKSACCSNAGGICVKQLPLTSAEPDSPPGRHFRWLGKCARTRPSVLEKELGLAFVPAHPPASHEASPRNQPERLGNGNSHCLKFSSSETNQTSSASGHHCASQGSSNSGSGTGGRFRTCRNSSGSTSSVGPSTANPCTTCSAHWAGRISRSDATASSTSTARAGTGKVAAGCTTEEARSEARGRRGRGWQRLRWRRWHRRCANGKTPSEPHLVCIEHETCTERSIDIPGLPEK